MTCRPDTGLVLPRQLRYQRFMLMTRARARYARSGLFFSLLMTVAVLVRALMPMSTQVQMRDIFPDTSTVFGASLCHSHDDTRDGEPAEAPACDHCPGCVLSLPALPFLPGAVTAAPVLSEAAIPRSRFISDPNVRGPPARPNLARGPPVII
jgi:hypothetical protein